jgi:predicted dehydrogenase
LAAKETLLPQRTLGGKQRFVDAEDYVLARMRVRNIEVICESDLVTPSYMNYVEVHGSNGSLFTSILHYMPTIVYCREMRGIFSIGNNIQTFQPVNLFDLEIGHFVRALQRNELPTQNGIQDSLAVLSVIDRIRSQRTRDEVAV